MIDFDMWRAPAGNWVIILYFNGEPVPPVWYSYDDPTGERLTARIRSLLQREKYVRERLIDELLDELLS